MMWVLIAIALACVAIAGGKGGLQGFAAFMAANLVVWSAIGFMVFAPGSALALAAAATALFLLVGGLGMLNEWFGKREHDVRAARVAAGGDYLTVRERKLKTAWDQGRELERISAQIAKAQATLQFIGSAVAADPRAPDPGADPIRRRGPQTVVAKAGHRALRAASSPGFPS